MTIYEPKILSERILRNFVPTRLAIKELAGQFYFCKSIRKDIECYSGSGVVWKKRIKKYGKNNIKTLWVSDWYYDPYEIQEIALHFSRENQIVESDKWANIKPENGLDGMITDSAVEKGMLTRIKNGTTHDSPAIKQKILDSKNRNGTMNSNSKESIAKMIETRTKNGNINQTSDSINKQMKTRLEKGIANSNCWTDDSVNKLNETRLRNGTHPAGSKNGRYDSTVYHWFNINTHEEVRMTQYEFNLTHNLSSGGTNPLIKGRRKIHKGWRVVTTDITQQA